MILSNKVAWHLGGGFVCLKQRYFFDIIFMHLGVVKVGLLRLAKPEVINLRLVLAKKSTLDNFSSNFDKP